jgi:hypothetical protein
MKGLSVDTTSPFFMLVLGVLSFLLVMLPAFLLENPYEAASTHEVTAPLSEKAAGSAELSSTEGRGAQEAVPAPPAPSTLRTPLRVSAPANIQQGSDSWSLGTAIISIISLAEALVVMSVLFVRRWHTPFDLFAQGFILRVPLLVIALICLVSTGITADFAQPAAVFDRMTLPVATLFVVQQLMLTALREPQAPALQGGEGQLRFRAERRYES